MRAVIVHFNVCTYIYTYIRKKENVRAICLSVYMCFVSVNICMYATCLCCVLCLRNNICNRFLNRTNISITFVLCCARWNVFPYVRTRNNFNIQHVKGLNYEEIVEILNTNNDVEIFVIY